MTKVLSVLFSQGSHQPLCLHRDQWLLFFFPLPGLSDFLIHYFRKEDIMKWCIWILFAIPSSHPHIVALSFTTDKRNTSHHPNLLPLSCLSPLFPLFTRFKNLQGIYCPNHHHWPTALDSSHISSGVSIMSLKWAKFSLKEFQTPHFDLICCPHSYCFVLIENISRRRTGSPNSSLHAFNMDRVVCTLVDLVAW